MLGLPVTRVKGESIPLSHSGYASSDVCGLIEGFGEGFYAVDPAWRITLFNGTATHHFRITPEQAIGRVLWELFPTAAASNLGSLFRKAMQNRELISSITESAVFPGRWLSYRLFPFRDGMGIVFRDITDLRTAETALRDSEQRYRSLVEEANDLVVTLDFDFTITSANNAVRRVLGYETHEFIGTSLSSYVPAAQLATHRAMLQRKIAGGTSTTYQMTAKDRSGRWRILETNSRLSFDASGTPREIHAIARDVTEQREAEQELRASEERLRLAASATGLGLFEIDWRKRKRYWSPEVAAILRAPTEADFSVNSAVIKRIMPEPYLTAFRKKLAASMDPVGNGHLQDEHPIHRLDGSRGWVHIRGKTIFETAGATRQAVRTIGLVLDITDRKQAEETDALLAAVVRSSRDAMISLDAARQIRTWNQGAERLYGYTAKETIGRPMSILAPGTLGDEVLRKTAEVLAGSEIDFETERRHKNGSLVPVQISAAPMRSSTGSVIGMSAVHRDISERKRHEDHMNFTMRELSHRTKNVLAVVQAIARQLGSRSVSIAQFQQRLSNGIQALAFCHDLLIEQEWRGATLDRLVELQLSVFGIDESARLAISGPPVLLQPHATQLVGLALHELGTNAAKYGALSNTTGVVEVSWEQQEDGSTLLTWQERGGPKVKTPQRRGFGHAVLSRAAASLETQASYEWDPAGVTWRIRIPVQHLLIDSVC